MSNVELRPHYNIELRPHYNTTCSASEGPWRIFLKQLNLDMTIEVSYFRGTSTLEHEFEHVKDYISQAYIPLRAYGNSMGSHCHCSKKKADCIAQALAKYSLSYYFYKAQAYTLRRVDMPDIWPPDAWVEEEAAGYDNQARIMKEELDRALDECEVE